jgi:CheY-like chemotaxis protein
LAEIVISLDALRRPAVQREVTTAMSQTPRILIVEDQYFVAIDSEATLHGAGFECVGLATTAKQAVDMAEREQPDLVLMDIRLASRTDGVDAAVVIYERLGIRSIFCSAHADGQVRLAREALLQRRAARGGAKRAR